MPGRLQGQAPGIILKAPPHGRGSMDPRCKTESEEARWVNLQSANPFPGLKTRA
jgi:hypothetical protein